MIWLEKRIRLPALLTGVAADWLATAVLITCLGLAFGLSADTPEQQIQELTQSGEFLLLGALVGVACTALGGFVAGRVAKQDEILHSGFVGLLSLILGALVELLSRSTGGSGVPLWYQVFSYLAVVPAALLGGFLSSRLQPRTEHDGSVG